MPASRWDDLMHNCCEGPLGASLGHGCMAHGGMKKIDTWKAGKKTSKKSSKIQWNHLNITGFGDQQLDQSTLLPPLGVL